MISTFQLSREDARVRAAAACGQPGATRRDRDWPGTDHNDLAVCTHFFGAPKLLLYCDATRRGRSKVVSIKKWRPQSGIGDGGDATGASTTTVAARPEFGEVPLRATYFDRSSVPPPSGPLRRLSAPIRRDINECFCARATERVGLGMRMSPFEAVVASSPDSHRGVR